MAAAWIIYHKDGEVRTMHAYTVEQAHDLAKHYTSTNEWAWAKVAKQVERYDSPDFAKRTSSKAAA